MTTSACNEPDAVASAILRYSLTEALKLQGITLCEFCRAKGIDRSSYCRFLGGSYKRVSRRLIELALINAGFHVGLIEAVKQGLWAGTPVIWERPDDLVMPDEINQAVTNPKPHWYHSDRSITRQEFAQQRWRRIKGKKKNGKRRATLARNVGFKGDVSVPYPLKKSIKT